VACGWAIYAFFTAPDIEHPLTVAERIVKACAYTTCPTLVFGLYFYWVPFVNAATYGAVGILVELLRREPTAPT
jgi:hypothetical protein